MTWTFIYLMVALKIPIVALFMIVHWAIKQTPESASEGSDDGNVRREPPHPRRTPPRRPRRGPHGAPLPDPPPRVRSVTARGRDAASHS